MLSAKRDVRAAERFFRKALKASCKQEPRVINVNTNVAYPSAIDELKEDQTLPKTTELRLVKYLNNIVEQHYQFIKRLYSTEAYDYWAAAEAALTAGISRLR